MAFPNLVLCLFLSKLAVVASVRVDDPTRKSNFAQHAADPSKDLSNKSITATAELAKALANLEGADGAKASASVTAAGKMMLALGTLAGTLGGTPTFQDRVTAFEGVADSLVGVGSLFMGPWGPVTAALGTLVVHGVAALFQIFGPQDTTPSPLAQMYAKIMKVMQSYVQTEVIVNEFALAYAEITEIISGGLRDVVTDKVNDVSILRNEVIDSALRQKMVGMWGPSCWLTKSTVTDKIVIQPTGRIGAYSCEDFENQGSAVLGIPAASMHISLLMDMMINDEQAGRLENKYLRFGHINETAAKYLALATSAVQTHKTTKKNCIEWNDPKTHTTRFETNVAILSPLFGNLLGDKCFVGGTWDLCKDKSILDLEPSCNKDGDVERIYEKEKNIFLYEVGPCDSGSSTRYRADIERCIRTYTSKQDSDMSIMYDKNLDAFKSMVQKIAEAFQKYKDSLQPVA
jgi:hypothetical protein